MLNVNTICFLIQTVYPFSVYILINYFLFLFHSLPLCWCAMILWYIPHLTNWTKLNLAELNWTELQTYLFQSHRQSFRPSVCLSVYQSVSAASFISNGIQVNKKTLKQKKKLKLNNNSKSSAKKRSAELSTSIKK